MVTFKSRHISKRGRSWKRRETSCRQREKGCNARQVINQFRVTNVRDQKGGKIELRRIQVCMDKEVGVFFQPCGHITCCQVEKIYFCYYLRKWECLFFHFNPWESESVYLLLSASNLRKWKYLLAALMQVGQSEKICNGINIILMINCNTSLPPQDCSARVTHCPNCRGAIEKRLRAFHIN